MLRFHMNLLYLLLLAGYSFTKGFYSFAAILVLLLCFVFWFMFVIRKKNKHRLDSVAISVELLVIVSYFFSIILYGGLYQRNNSIISLSVFLSIINLILVIYLIYSKTNTRHIFIIIFFIGILLRIFMVISSPNPYIDVFDYLKQGALGFTSGQNPYSLIYFQFYKNVVPNFYSYFPFTIIASVPFVLVFKDPRIMTLFAELMSVYILYRIASNKKAYMYPLLMLGNPMSLYLIEQSYIEPLILLLFTLLMFYLYKQKNVIAGVILGLLLATKQYVIFFPLFLIRSYIPKKYLLKLFLLAVLTALFFILPFYLWNPKDFIHDTILLQYNFSPRYEGLTFFSLLYNLFHVKYNVIISYIPIFIILLVTLKNKLKNPSMILINYTFFLFTFFLFNKWAFLNYYYLISQLFIVQMFFESYKNKTIKNGG